MLFYLTEGQAFAVVASNAGAAEAPAWWLNLQAQPRATVEVPSGSASVQAREATPGEQERLWTRFVAQLADYQKYAAATDRDIPVVMLEPTREDPHA